MSFFSKRKPAVLSIALAGLLAFGGAIPASGASSVESEAGVKVSYKGKTFSVNLVTIDLTDPTLEVAPAMSAGGIGHDEPFGNIIARENAVAAINGTFFNAYEKNPYIRYPNGALLEDGELIHSGENQTLFIGPDKVPDIDLIDLDVTVHVREGGGTYAVKPWGVNKYYGESNIDQVVLYTDDFGGWVGFPNGTKAVIEDGAITRITTDSVPVPKDGYVLFVGHSNNNKTYVIPKLDVTDPVRIDLNATNGSGQSLDARSWLAAIGVGPKLVTNGAMDLNFSRDGFTDPKITSASAARSFVGVDRYDRLVFGTVSAATMEQLAGIAIQLGLKEAMNMDGGASSGLYANGRMLTSPGRELSNALVVRKLDKPKVQIAIDGRYIPDFKGFIERETTIVPIRPFITALNADFHWDAATKTATISHGGVTLKLQDGASSAIVNGKKVSVPVPLKIHADSRMYVPLRFVAESLNATVGWDAKLYRANITLP
ncbi:stalk domain-containing protein [Paenibacillus thermoaerophilus]|uniref:Stalk domain-containing protein n=1 Tax=Paenibacillus thermoaerophilus TaxID=1215385 RepID=A0ABW2V4F2_9BACL|nr:phosphodiester glycosidase family protein [Paenibacillus thermoaerophilus]TMV17479.1 hypothetical protein FE781_07065 [Paenibacillus thermoaerophilus]